VQARTQGLVSGSLESLRAMVAMAFVPTVFHPRRDQAKRTPVPSERGKEQ